MGKNFKGNDYTNKISMASEYSVSFNDSDTDIDTDFPEDIAQLRQENPGLFEGPFSIFGPRTREDIEAWDREVQRQIREGECRPVSELFGDLKREFPWLTI